jgi:hypothetical protein
MARKRKKKIKKYNMQYPFRPAFSISDIACAIESEGK